MKGRVSMEKNDLRNVALQLAQLNFEHGMPTASTAQNLYDIMDVQRAVLCYLWAMPIVGMQSAKEALIDNAGAVSGDMVLIQGYRDVGTMLGSNVTTPYFLSYFDLSSGPVVIEYPPGATAGSLIDWQDRPIADVGAPGLDQGHGAVFLLVGPDQIVPENLPANIEVLHSRTFKALLFGRVLDSCPEASYNILKSSRFYPYGSEVRNTGGSILRFKKTGVLTTMAHPKGIAYWERIATAIQDEPVEDRDLFFAAMLKPLGIQTGQSFKPNPRQVKILYEAAELGEAMAKAIAFKKRFPGIRYRMDSNWEYLIPPYYSMQQDIPNETLFEERTAFFYEVMGASEAVMTRKPGVGSGYLTAYYDAGGQVLDGGKTYLLRVPFNPPAKLFWSITLYDTETRCFIQNSQEIVDRSSKDPLQRNFDGSVDIIMSPTPPDGLETNWIPTSPGKAWYAYFRLFGPLEPYLERTWSLPDIEQKRL